MIPYYIMLGIPVIIASFGSLLKFKRIKIKNFDQDKVIIDSFFIIWLILLMFRSSELGIDLPVYQYHFKNYSALSWKDIFVRIFTKEFEASFSLISKSISIFTDNFQIVLVICALISVIPIWMLYRKNAKHGYLMVVLFVNIAPFVMYFSGLRQVIAMALVVPCYYFCKEKKIVYYLIMVVLAYFMHNSAFVLLVMYPVYHLRLKKDWHILYIIPVIVVIRRFSTPIFSVLLRFVGTKYYEQYEAGIKTTGAYSVLLLLTVLLLYSFVVVDSEKLDSDTQGLRNILLLCVMIQIFSGVHTLAMRMNYYFLLFVPLLIPRIMDRGKKNYKLIMKLSLICMVCFFTVYYYYEAYTGGDILGIYPYVSLFRDY